MGGGGCNLKRCTNPFKCRFLSSCDIYNHREAHQEDWEGGGRALCFLSLVCVFFLCGFGPFNFFLIKYRFSNQWCYSDDDEEDDDALPHV